MKTVDAKEFEARLSEYLRLVKRGETIQLTECGDVVAEIRPARHALAVPNGLEEVLDALAAAGEITRASMPGPRGVWRARGLGLPAGTAATLLDQQREEH